MRRNLPSLGALEAFEAVARLGSTTAAAESLGRTQSAVSRQIANMESFAQRSLFERRQNRMMLNAAGHYLADCMTPILDRLEHTVRRACTFDAAARLIHIQMWPTFAARWFAPRLSAFGHAHPEIQVQIKLDAKLEFNRDDPGVDGAILYGPEPWPDLEHFQLVPEALTAVVSPEIYETFGPDLLAYDWLHMPSRPHAWTLWSAQRMNGRSADRATRTFPVSLLVELAALGEGVALLPSIYVESELSLGRLIAPFGPELLTGKGYHLCYTPETPHLSEISAFRYWLAETSSP